MPQNSNTVIEKIGHYTTWAGDLTTVIVGNIPGPSFFEELPDNQIKKHCQKIVAQTKNDLDNLAKTYERYGVSVFRPKIINDKPCIKSCSGVNVLNPRPNISPFDHIFCRDNKILLTWQDIERFEDFNSIKHITNKMSNKIEIINIQPPNFYDYEYYNKLDMDLYPGDKDILLDSPSFSPAGKDIFYSKRYVCSKKGLTKIKHTFPDANFIGLDYPITNHLDAQFRIIKEGHVISCHSKDNLINLIPQFKNWTIHHDDSWKKQKLQIIPQTPMSAWLDDDENDASITLGFVHIKPNLVVIQRENKNICSALEKAKVDWILSPIKYDQYFGLAVSCATAILHRTDECIDYFS